MEVDLRGYGIDPAIKAALNSMFDFADDVDSEKPQPPSRAYVRDRKAMRNTPADIVEFPNRFEFIIDMPGVRPDQMKVHVEEGNLLVVSGQRRRREKEEGVKYVRMERRLGKMLKKFLLPENVKTETISAVCRDGVLTVTVEKVPPPEPKKARSIEVKAGGLSEEEQGAEGQVW